jgi:hypothetical protein
MRTLTVSTALSLALCLGSACYTSSSTPPAPLSGSSTQAPAARGAKSLSVTCSFSDGWVAVVPRAVFRRDDEYTMQGLIGLTEDPDFWKTVDDMKRLQPYAARRCSDQPVVFDQVGSDALLLVGKANTFDQATGYGINGAIREIRGATEIKLTARDLDISWPCISCPRLYAWTDRGWELRGEVLIDVIGARAETTQRRAIGKLRVIGGEVRLRLAEEEDEISHVDALVLEIQGLRVQPSAGSLHAIDGVRATLKRGDAIELRYAVGLPDGEYEAGVAATGYYLPLGKLR